MKLLHECRLKLEAMQDTLQAGRQLPKLRNYRQRAQKDYDRFCRNRRPSRALIKKAIKMAAQLCGKGSSDHEDNASRLNCQPEPERVGFSCNHKDTSCPVSRDV